MCNSIAAVAVPQQSAVDPHSLTPTHTHAHAPDAALQVFDKQCVQAGGLCQINFLDPNAGGYGNTTSMLRGLALVRKNDPIVFMEVGGRLCRGAAVLGLLYSSPHGLSQPVGPRMPVCTVCSICQLAAAARSRPRASTPRVALVRPRHTTPHLATPHHTRS
jgi:hypothetical protein